MTELLRINPHNPEIRKINRVTQTLIRGGIIIYPTDTVYGIGCDIRQTKGVEGIYRLRNIKAKTHNLAIVCQNFSQVSEYIRPIDGPTFKLLKKAFPGPYTFILPAGGRTPRFLRNNRKTIGIRIPDHPVPTAIVGNLENPIVTTSLKDPDEILEYTTDPEEIYENFKSEVDIVIDGGMGGNIPSTVVDLTSGSAEVIREGKGEVFW